ncbi:hypothetical protein CHS0354_014760 [Potamilus streckersoni]|uniref:Apple domain-containing protein n=1 Tax=Potamilus streckersoni TaxID=2493646 RepID=A0AAE0WA42_9BIVA|nr:hypothetical protein CHS0354_014760 [Potamilus streckersoni]
MNHNLDMSRTFSLPVRDFFLITCLLPSTISSTKWELDNDFENNLDTSDLLWEKDEISMLTCASLCTQKQSCLSFFYNLSLKKCLGSKSFKRGLPANQAKHQEWKYYTRPQQCDRGYAYNKTLGLCYKIFFEFMNRSDSMVKCESEGAKLIIIENAIEFKHIKNGNASTFTNHVTTSRLEHILLQSLVFAALFSVV